MSELSTNKPCKNCEESFDDSFEFCPYCGQKAKDDLTIGVLFYNTISNYFSFDARFLKSFIPLMFRPGYLARRFVEGKRLLYLHPAQMYLFISVVFFFMFSFKIREYNSNLDKAIKKGFEMEQSKDSINLMPLDSAKLASITNPLKNTKLMEGMSENDRAELDSVFAMTTKSQKIDNNFNFGYDTVKLDSLIANDAPEQEQLAVLGQKEDTGFFGKLFYKQGLKFHKNKGGGILQAFYDSIPISLFVLLPIFALILKIFFWRRGAFAHHLVFSFYFFSFLFVSMCIILGVNFIWDIQDWIDWMVILSTFVYLVIAIKQFYQQGYFISFIKSVMVSFLYMLFVLPIALMIMVGLSFLLY